MPSRLLVVEDDEDLATTLRRELGHAGHEVLIVGDGPAALRVEHDWCPDLVLLDLGLARLDGIELCRRLRSKTRAPILILTGRDGVTDGIRALDAGADDSIVKPFALDELMTRVRAALRRSDAHLLRAADLVVDARARTVTRGGESIALTRREFELLECFVRHAGQVLARSTLLDHVWSDDSLGASNVVDVYVGYLRRKLDRSGEPSLIKSVRGIGYALCPPP